VGVATSRERILEASTTLLRRQGLGGTGIKQILTAAEAPFGSLYHHFPGGKDELADETIRTAGAAYGLLFPAIYGDAPDLVAGTTTAFALAAIDLEAADYADACPVATVALEVASTNDRLRRATADVFDGWIDEGSALFAARGLDEPTARRVIIALISALEGAFVLSRALRSTEPLAAAGRAMEAVVRDALEGAGDTPV
jgi:AcrR family transcriptional regulator